MPTIQHRKPPKTRLKRLLQNCHGPQGRSLTGGHRPHCDQTADSRPLRKGLFHAASVLHYVTAQVNGRCVVHGNASPADFPGRCVASPAQARHVPDPIRLPGRRQTDTRAAIETRRSLIKWGENCKARRLQRNFIEMAVVAPEITISGLSLRIWTFSRFTTKNPVSRDLHVKPHNFTLRGKAARKALQHELGWTPQHAAGDEYFVQPLPHTAMSSKSLFHAGTLPVLRLCRIQQALRRKVSTQLATQRPHPLVQRRNARRTQREPGWRKYKSPVCMMAPRKTRSSELGHSVITTETTHGEPRGTAGLTNH